MNNKLIINKIIYYNDIEKNYYINIYFKFSKTEINFNNFYIRN